MTIPTIESASGIGDVEMQSLLDIGFAYVRVPNYKEVSIVLVSRHRQVS